MTSYTPNAAYMYNMCVCVLYARYARYTCHTQNMHNDTHTM